MKKLIAYKTSVEHTDCIVEAFSNSINKNVLNIKIKPPLIGTEF